MVCYQQYCKEIYNKNNTNDKRNPQEELYEYICRLFNIEELNQFLNFQLQKIFKENNFTYNGVLYTLKYFFEVKENKPDIKYGIGIVPAVYEEAKNFYIKKSILWDKNQKVDIKKETNTVKVSTKPSKKTSLIDIDKL